MRRRRKAALLALAAAAAVLARPADAQGDECGDGTVTGPLSAHEAADLEALDALRNATGAELSRSEWQFSCWGFSPGARPCDAEGGDGSMWDGVSCNGSRVVALQLEGHGLGGDVAAVAAALARMGALAAVDLSHNTISGTVGSAVQGLGASLADVRLGDNAISGGLDALAAAAEAPPLARLDLSQNALTGRVPVAWGAAGTLLRVLRLEKNKLAGALEAPFAGLPLLEELWLDENSGVAGELPVDWRSLPSLSGVLSLAGTSVSGTLPDSFRGLERLSELWLADTGVSGTMPYAFSGLDALRTLAVGTTAVSGTLAARFEGLSSLRFLDASATMLSGLLPAEWRGVERLQRIDLSGNLGVGGTLPGRFSGLPGLFQFVAGACSLSGTLPERLGGLPNLTEFRAPLNRLSGTAESLAGWGAAAPNLGWIDVHSNSVSGRLPPRWLNSSWISNIVLDNNPVSGTFPAAWEGLGNLDTLSVRACALSGTLPDQYEGLSWASRLNLAGNRISGTLGSLRGLPKLVSLELQSNLLSGTLPVELDGADLLRVLHLSGNLMSGRPVARPRGTSVVTMLAADNLLAGELLEDEAQPMLQLDFSNNPGVTGPLPSWLYVGRDPQQAFAVDLTGCSFSSWGRALENTTALALASMPALRLGRNALSGTVPEALCALKSVQLMSLEHNGLAGRVPDCLARMPNLAVLDASNNRLDTLPAAFAAAGAAPALRAIRLSGNVLTAAGLLAGGGGGGGGVGDDDADPPPRVSEVDLSSNPLKMNADNAVVLLAAAFPRLAVLRLDDTQLRGAFTEVGDASLGVTTLSVRSNRGFYGFDSDTFTPSTLETLDVSGSGFVNAPPGGLNGLVRVSLAGVPRGVTCPAELLESPRLEMADFSGDPGFTASCNDRIQSLLRVETSTARLFPELGDLQCPSWVTAVSSAQLRAGASFLGFERCSCAGSNRVWDATRRGCVDCPRGSPPHARVRCDPFVLAPSHCVLGNVWPAPPASEYGRGPPRLLTDAAGLLDARLPRCSLVGMCNSRSDLCEARRFDAGDHTRGAVAPPLDFACATGHDESSVLCARCERGYWARGAQCVRCDAVSTYAVPAAGLAGAGAVLAYLLWDAGVRTSGRRMVSTLFLFLQLVSLLEASMQANAHASTTSRMLWPGLTHVFEALRSVAAVRPAALRCALPGLVTFGTTAAATMGAAPAFAALCALAAAVLPRRLGARAAYAGAWVSLVGVFPAAAAAFLLFSCVDVAGVAVLTAAPYVLCEDAAALRAGATVTLAAYVLPLCVATAVVARRGARVVAAGAVPLLGPGERAGDGDGGGGGGGRHPAAQYWRADLSFVDGPGADAAGLPDLLGAALAAVVLPPLRDSRALWWWPVAYDLGRKLVLACALGVLHVDSEILPVLVFFTLAAAVAAHQRYRPWRRQYDNLFETAALSAVLAVYMVTAGAGVKSSSGESPGQVTTLVVESTISLVYACVFGLFGWVLWRRRGELVK